MKRYFVFFSVLAFIFLVLSGKISRPALLGYWENDSSTLFFGGSGICELDGEKGVFRLKDGVVCVYSRTAEAQTYPYMVSFDGKSLYLGGERYIKTVQSGAERSIIELLLTYSPESLS